MAKVETCDVFLPEFGLELGLALQNGRWVIVVTAQRKARRPRNAEPIAAFVRPAPYSYKPRAKRTTH